MSAIRCPACHKLCAPHANTACSHCGAALPPQPAAASGGGSASPVTGQDPAAAAPAPGAPLEGVAVTAPSAGLSTPSERARALKPCKHCGATNPGSARVCHSCNKPIVALRVVGETDQNPLVAFLLAALIPGAAYLYLGRGRQAAIFFFVAIAATIGIFVIGGALPAHGALVFNAGAAVIALSRLVEVVDAVRLCFVQKGAVEPLPIDPHHKKTALPPPKHPSQRERPGA